MCPYPYFHTINRQTWRTYVRDAGCTSGLYRPDSSCSYCMVRFSGDRRIPWPDMSILLSLRPILACAACCGPAMLRTFRRPWRRHSFRADVRRIPWPDRHIPWPDVRGLCQLPERRAICRLTKLKCCDRVPDAVSCDATICLIRDEEPGSSDAVC